MVRPAALWVTTVGLLLGCQGGSDALIAHLQRCGLATEGRAGPYTLAGRLYAPTPCYEDCLRSASCEELSEYLCTASIALPLRCDQRCAARCSDGSLIGPEAICNGNAECADGSDEQGCPVFRCADGTELHPTVECDGWPQCPDGSDEAGCDVLRCDGNVVPPYARCDGSPYCSDGSDEAGCPVHECADGTTISAGQQDPVCNGWAQCPDGSDERDCAQIMPMCPGA